MKKHLNTAAIAVIAVCSSFMIPHDDADFEIRIVASGLSDPWSLVCAPSGELWLTESKGYRIVKLDPQKGISKTVLDLNSERKFVICSIKEKWSAFTTGWFDGTSTSSGF